ncbi:RNA exonuclease 4 [Blattella germanica]|nr:RNA exonuclease 4 [Blattella germanica]
MSQTEKVCDTTNSTGSNPPQKKKKRKWKAIESKNVQHTKEPNQTNGLANFVFSMNNISSNWKNFKQNMSEGEGTKAGAEKKQNTFGNRLRYNNAKQQATSTTNSDNSVKTANPPPTYKHFKSDSKKETKVVAIDCEMVGIDSGKDNMLARVSLVNKYGNCIYDKYVLPKEPVVDYRTHVSGIRPRDLRNGEVFETVQKEVAEILKGKILVGHALRNDLKVLYLNHPRRAIRDTSNFKLFRKITNGNTPSLRKLTEELLGIKIQQGEHDSVVDARAAMQLYILYRKEWEKDINSRPFQKKPTTPSL